MEGVEFDFALIAGLRILEQGVVACIDNAATQPAELAFPRHGNQLLVKEGMVLAHLLFLVVAPHLRLLLLGLDQLDVHVLHAKAVGVGLLAAARVVGRSA